MHPESRLPQLQVNTRYSTFTSFYTFLENAGLVPRTHDVVLLCGAALPNGDDDDPTIPNYLPATHLADEVATTKSKSTYNSGHTLQLTRDGL